MTLEQKNALEQEAIKTATEIEQVIKNAQTMAAQFSGEIQRLQQKQSALLAAVEE